METQKTQIAAEISSKTARMDAIPDLKLHYRTMVKEKKEENKQHSAGTKTDTQTNG
jgi:hypothetical protein